MSELINDLTSGFYDNFIYKGRWKYITEGISNTLIITAIALIIGILIGAIIAGIRTSYDNQYKDMKPGINKFCLCIFNKISKVYLTIIRGTPVVVQLMIIYYIIFTDLLRIENDILIASIAFGLNSGAYVAEIFRSGLMSIDAGQYEAGRSLGFNYLQTMFYIIIPQAFKNVLPTLANEFIVLLKETSVAGYVGIQDLTKGGDIIRSATYQPYFPLIGVACVYLILVMIFTWLVGRLERRLRRDER